MNSSSKKIIAFLSALAMTLPLLASCAEDEEEINNNKVEQTAATETAQAEPEFASGDFDGAEFVIISSQDEASDFKDHYIDNEERTGEPINDAVIDRNMKVEEKYNVNIIRRPNGDIVAASKSGTVDFHLVYGWGAHLVRRVLDGVYFDFNNAELNLNLDRDYWAPSAQDSLTIANKMLITTCDISMNRIGYAGFLAFNKNLLDKYNIEYPYTMVKQNEWTFDNYMTLATQISEDVNGDTIWGVEDVYGTNQAGLGYIIDCAGISDKLTVKNEDGTYELNVYTDKLTQIYNKYHGTFDSIDAICRIDSYAFGEGRDLSKYDSPHQAGRIISFGEGHMAFKGMSMAYIPELVGAGIDFQFGVVPNPKYEASQKEYYHFIDSNAPMFAIPKQAPDMEMVGTVLDYLAYQSRQTLLPAFYEQTIKTKCMSDPEGRDEDMLDIVRDSVRYLWTELYQQTIFKADGTYWNPPGKMLSEMLAAGNFASVNKRYVSAAKKSLDDLFDAIDALDMSK